MALTRSCAMTGISIRRARIDEAAAIAALVRASITELCLADHGGDSDIIDRLLENKTEDALRDWLSRDDRTIFVTESDDGIAAAGCHDTRGVVLMNYIAPSHRLKGISNAMLTHLETAMRQAGISESRLVSTATARRFYEARGWQAYGELIPCMGVTGQPMRKRL